MKSILIRSIQEMVYKPLSDYAIGVTDNPNKVAKNKGKGGMVVFNYRNDLMTLEAYLYFNKMGMFAHDPIGERSKYLYLYRLDGKEIYGVI